MSVHSAPKMSMEVAFRPIVLKIKWKVSLLWYHYIHHTVFFPPSGFCQFCFLTVNIILYPSESQFILVSPYEVLSPTPTPRFLNPITACFIPIIEFTTSSCQFPPLPFSPQLSSRPLSLIMLFVSLSCCLMIFPADKLCSQY